MPKALPTFSHHYATVASVDARVRLHYVQCGAGTPVLLIHGWPQTWFEWRLVMPLLADRHTLVAPDLRGLGDSSRPASGYDKKTLAHDLWLLMSEHLGHARFAVVGHDWGSAVAARLAMDHPDAVTHLALLDVPCSATGRRRRAAAWATAGITSSTTCRTCRKR